MTYAAAVAAVTVVAVVAVVVVAAVAAVALRYVNMGSSLACLCRMPLYIRIYVCNVTNSMQCTKRRRCWLECISGQGSVNDMFPSSIADPVRAAAPHMLLDPSQVNMSYKRVLKT